MSRNMDIVIFDTEYTTWDGAQQRRWTGISEYKEIIQIGAVKASWPDGNISNTLTLTIKPKINPVLSDYCMGLTHLTQGDIDNGLPFQAALNGFLSFVAGCPSLSYGNDAAILAENIVLNKSDPLSFYGKDSPSFVNIKYWIHRAIPEATNVTSGNLWTLLDNKPPNQFIGAHKALSDCLSILSVLLKLHERNALLPL